jgi:hypothetical protein
MTPALTIGESLLCTAMATASLAAWLWVFKCLVRGLRGWPDARPRDD